ncbi:MAG: GMC family oxidoreductase [bacterium]
MPTTSTNRKTMKYGFPDAVIVGSGAGGGIAAKMLAEGGLKVVLLEKGDNHFVGLDRPEGIVRNRFGNDELKFLHRDFIDQDARIEPRTFRSAEGEKAHFVGKVNTLAVTVGGGTIHYDGNSPRVQHKDFRVRSTWGPMEGTAVEDWPLSYAELEPYYDEVEKGIGVQGGAGVNPFEEPRSSPYPMPPGYPKYHSVLLAEAARSLGYHPYPTPIAINSVAYRGRPACTNCGFCGNHGCAVNAKGSTAVTAIRDALLTGNCELRPNCFVYGLQTNGNGTAVESVEYIGPGGETVSQPGGLFLLACNAIESARLCLLSAGGAHPAGLGNRSGLVGRNLMFHPTRTTFGILPQRTHIHRGRVGTQGMDDFLRPADPGDPDRVFGGGVVEFGAQLHPIAEAKNLPLIGDKHKKYMRASLLRDHLAVITFIGEDPPVPTNRVDLDPDVRDVYRFPVARITYRTPPQSLVAQRLYAPRLERILQEAGAVFVLSVPQEIQNAGIQDTKHIMGTLRMGTDPELSVTDRYGRFHDLENLYCADGGVFVTSTGYNPTLTIQALACRQAHRILE